tara:strand:+ start:154 stop:642 length:489 start_codon:yes stop_codon:yes gene_type:complete
MLKTLKKNKKYIIIVAIILVILAIFYMTKLKLKKSKTPDTDKAVPTETQSPSNKNNNNVGYNITNTHVNILSDDGKIVYTYEIKYLKPKVLQRAKIYGRSLKKFEQEMSKPYNYWMDLIFIEYNIDKNLSNKEKYCKLRSLTGNCNILKNDCPIECVNEETE